MQLIAHNQFTKQNNNIVKSYEHISIPCCNMSLFKFSICLLTLSLNKALPQAEGTLNRTKLPALAWHYPTAAKKLQGTGETRVNIARETQGSARVLATCLVRVCRKKTAERQIWWNLKANPAACNLISWHAAATLHAAASFGQFATGRLQHSHVQGLVPESEAGQK